MINSGNDWLDPDPVRAAEKYRELRRALIEYFARRRCFDPENLADEVFWRVIEQIKKGTRIEKEDPRNFAYGVAKYVYYEYVRKDIRQEKTLKEVSSPGGPISSQISIPSNLDPCMEECLKGLNPEEREMLERWYLDKDHRKLEEDMGISPNGVRIRIYRIKRKFTTCYDDCKKP